MSDDLNEKQKREGKIASLEGTLYQKELLINQMMSENIKLRDTIAKLLGEKISLEEKVAALQKEETGEKVAGDHNQHPAEANGR